MNDSPRVPHRVPLRFPACVPRPGSWLLLAVLLVPTASSRAEVVARPSPVEVVCPMPPAPVRADGQSALCYELHITNFGQVPLTLRRVSVFGGGPRDPESPLVTLADSTLGQALRLVGPGPDPARLEPGRRTILFMWLALPPARAAALGALRHTLTFQFGDSTTAFGAPLHESRLDGCVVPVAGRLAGGRSAPAPLLAPPFRGGTWLAGSGPGNTSDHRRTVIALAGRASISQRFAIDWVRIGANGDTWHDDVTKLENWWGYGEPILAAAEGVVTRVVDAYPDNPPRTTPPLTLDNLAGNFVIIRFAPERYVMCAHLRRGSIRVHEGQRVRRGEWLAELGNSGNTTGPHLHFQVMDANAAVAAEGVPWRFAAFHCLGFGRDYEPAHHPDVEHRLEIPTDDMVVSFP